MSLKIITVLGARPQFIKAAPVSRALEEAGLQESILHTGQHFDANMSDVFFDELGIPKPKFHLGVNGGSHGVMTGRMLEGIEKVLLEHKPDAVLVYGDTNSTLAGALAASKLLIPVVHVEAGLRSFNMKMPEEQNRILTDHISSLLLAPTQLAVENLLREGIQGSKVSLTGDVMFDAALYYGDRAETSSRILKQLGIEKKNYILSTIHRAENTNDLNRLRAIFDGLLKACGKMKLVLPLHPRTKNILQKEGFTINHPNLKLIDPVGYLDMVMLEKNAALIATDSGGVQKEAFFYQVPCVTLRDETEWVELVDLGWNHLLSPQSAEQVAVAIDKAMGSKGRLSQPYGNGKASIQIAKDILRSLKT